MKKIKKTTHPYVQKKTPILLVSQFTFPYHPASHSCSVACLELEPEPSSVAVAELAELGNDVVLIAGRWIDIVLVVAVRSRREVFRWHSLRLLSVVVDRKVVAP